MENEQTPTWAKPLEELIDTMGNIITTMTGAPAQPVQPAQPAEPQKSDSELLAENISRETARLTGRQDANPISTFSSLASSTPTGGGDFSQIAAQINQGTKQIIEQNNRK